MPRDYRYSHQKGRPSDGAVKRRRAWQIYLFMAVLVLGLLIAFRQILLPFLFAMIIVYVLAPLVRAMQARGVPRWGGVIICYAVIILALVGASTYLAPKLKGESVKVLQRFQTLLSNVPAAFDRVGEEVAELLDTLEGRQAGAATQSDAEAAQWGYGPRVLPVPVFDSGAPPSPERIEFGANDKETAQLTRELDPGSDRSPEEIRVDTEHSHIVLTRIADGVYGMRMNESTLEIRRTGDGSYQIVPKEAHEVEGDAATFRNRLIQSLRNSLEHFAGRIVREVVGLVRDIVSITTKAIVALVVLFMVAAFMLLDYVRIGAWMRSRVPQKFRYDYDDLCSQLDLGLSGVIRGQLIICLVNGTLSGIGFLIFIPEYALVFAVFSGVMSIIPIFGTIISTVPAVLIGVTVSWGTALAILLWILGIHALEANVLNPKIIAKQAHLSPILVIFSLVAGEAVFGIVGALLAVPVLSLLNSVMAFVFARIRPQIIES